MARRRGITKPVDDLSFGFALHPPKENGPAGEGATKLHALLFDHVRRALRLAARPPNLSGSAEIVIILDTSGRVLSMSPRAEQIVQRRDGLTIEQRQLVGRTTDVTARLDSAIKSALQSSRNGGSGGGVRLPRSAGPDWLTLVSPCPRSFDHLPIRSPAAVLRAYAVISTIDPPRLISGVRHNIEPPFPGQPVQNPELVCCHGLARLDLRKRASTSRVEDVIAQTLANRPQRG